LEILCVGGEWLECEGASLRVVHSPGHTADHVALWLREEAALFSGDAVLGEGTAVFADLGEYLRSLQLFVELFESEEGPAGALEGARKGRVYPGHGPVVEDGLNKIKEYISHRQLREDQIVDVLKKQYEVSSNPQLEVDIPSGLSAREIVSLIYPPLSPSLQDAAAGSVVLHLRKLLQERRVTSVAAAQVSGESCACGSSATEDSNTKESVRVPPEHLNFVWVYSPHDRL
jgi:glyoxylase-like metal-dependent hydrolase (beta-lactamase superfamily II)